MFRFKKKMKLFSAISFAVLAIATMAISTFAWFTIERSQTIETGLVTGSSEITVDNDNIYGYKVAQSRKSNGYVDYGTTTVTGMKCDTSDMSTSNDHQDGEDTDFDIPLSGIGYYFIPQRDNAYKYSNGSKMTQYTNSDSNLASLSNQTVTASNNLRTFAYRVREYGFESHETVSRKVDIEGVQSDNTAYLTAALSAGDILLTLPTGVASATFNVWFDYSKKTIGLEVTNHSTEQNSFAGKKPNQLYGNEEIYFKPNSGWAGDGAWFAAYFFTADESESHWEKMVNPQNDTTNYVIENLVDISKYTKVIFVRMNKNKTALDWDSKWNQTGNITIPSGSDNKRLLKDNSDWWDGQVPGNPNTCFWDTYGDYSREYKMTVGGNEYPLSKSDETPSGFLEQYYKTALTVTAGNTFSFKLNGKSFTPTADSAATNLTSGLAVKIGGTVDVYLKIRSTNFPDAVLYISNPGTETAKMKVGSSTTTMTKSTGTDVPTTLSNGDTCYAQYHLKGHTLGTGNTLSFKLNETNITVSKDRGAGNLTNSLGVVKGGKVDIYLKISVEHYPTSEVYISDVYTVTIGGNEFQLGAKKTNWAGHTEWYNENGINAAKDAVVSSVAKNGTTISGWGINSSAGNNVKVESETKKIIKACSGEGAYFDIVDNTLWITGNKKYTLNIYNKSNVLQSSTEMSTVQSGDFSGWYTLQNITVTKDYKAEVVYTTYDTDGSPIDAIQDLNYASSYTVGPHTYDNNNITNADKFITTGTSSVYFDTSNKKFYVTTVFSVQINGTTLEALWQSGSTYQTDTAFNIVDEDEYAVKAFANATEMTSWTASTNKIGDVENNLEGSAGSLHTRIFNDDPVYAIVYPDSGTIYVSGYHEPEYRFKRSTSTGFKAMNTVNKNAFNQDSDTRTATFTATAGETLTFFYGKSTPKDPALIGDGNNVTKDGMTYTIQDGGSVTIYWDITNNKLWVSGKTYTYYFVNTRNATNDTALFGSTMYAYAYYGNDVWHNKAWPGDHSGMTLIGGSDYIYSYNLVYDHPYSKIIFNDGGTHQTDDLTLSGNEGKYYWVSSTTTAKNSSNKDYYTAGGWYANPPSSAETKKLYFHDTYVSSHFGNNSVLYAYAEANDVVPNGGYLSPGTKMTTLIGNSLFVALIPSTYTDIVFGINSSTKTGKITTLASVSSGTIYLAKSALGNVPEVAKPSDVSAFGTATIVISYVDGSTPKERTRITMGTGDTANNYFIYENGVLARKGDTFVINYSGCTYLTPGTGTLNGSDVIDDPIKYPFLTVSGSTVTINTDGRYNFYVTNEGKIAVAMVPIYGNGFYIVPYANNTTEGYRNAVKMNTISTTSASYIGYYATAHSKVYFRSYLNAVDVLYKSAPTIIDSATETISDKLSFDTDTGVLDFGTYSGYLNFEISEGQIHIRPYSVSEFFKLNAIDPAKSTSKAAIKNQKTSLVLEVPFSVTTGHNLDIYLEVTNPFYDSTNDLYYVGCAACITDEKITPSSQSESAAYAIYTHMRTNYYDSLSGQIADSIGTTSSAGNYYAYILIDYIYNANLDYHLLRDFTV